MRFMGAARVLPFVGFNVTMPFKQAILPLCDEVAMLAKMAGAVNTVHVVDGRFIGYNTDGRGLVESLETEADFEPEGRDVVILGAGGAAGAAFVSLMLAKAKSVTVANRDARQGRGARLAHVLTCPGDGASRRGAGRGRRGVRARCRPGRERHASRDEARRSHAGSV